MKDYKNRKYRKMFVAFFAVMMILTILSRVIDSVVIPKVQVQTYIVGNLKYHIIGEGIVKPADKEYMDIPKGIKVEKVLSIGEKVKQGQGIIFLKLTDLEEKQKELERECYKQELSLEREKLGQKADAKTSQMEEIAGELALVEQNLRGLQIQIEKEQEEYAKAITDLNKKRTRDIEFEKQRRSISKEETNQINETLDNQSKKSHAQTELVYEEAISHIEDTYTESMKQLNETQENDMQDINNQQDTFNQLLYKAKLAVQNDENAKIKEQTTALISQKAQEILQVNVEVQKEELEKIVRLIQAGGEVKCPWQGVITKMDVIPGIATSGTEIIEIGRGKFLLGGSLNKESANLLEEGDRIQITMPLETKTIEGKVTNIQMSFGAEEEQSGKSSYAEFTAELEDGDYRIGSTAEYRMQKSTQMKYPCLLPLGAVREDSQGIFCLIAEQKRTILGDELIAVRIGLELLNKDDTHAAVSSVFTTQDRIIVGSNKAIAEGDRVRIEG